MGCLASGPDLLDEPSVDRDFEAESAADYADLPLWYGALVAPAARGSAPTPVEPNACSRLFWRSTVSRWPINRRQAWGDRANALEESGMGWKEAERVAFEQVMANLPPGRLAAAPARPRNPGARRP